MQPSQLIDDYVKTLPAGEDGQKACQVIALIGLPGSGKSTFSEALSAKTGLYVASNDKIRRWLEERGIEESDASQQVVVQIAEARTQLLLKRRISHIIDADIIKYQDMIRRNAEEYDAHLFIFHVTAPEDIILQRLERRASHQPTQLSRAAAGEYKVRKQVHAEIRMPEYFNLTVDMTNDINAEVERVVKYLHRLSHFMYGGIERRVTYVRTDTVKDGVECDVYRFTGDPSMDLGVIRIGAGFKTPRQRILKGDRTVEGYISGSATLHVTMSDTSNTSYTFPRDDIDEIDVRVGETMQWSALEDSILYEVCVPAYSDGRFKNLN